MKVVSMVISLITTLNDLPIGKVDVPWLRGMSKKRGAGRRRWMQLRCRLQRRHHSQQQLGWNEPPGMGIKLGVALQGGAPVR